MDVTGFPLTVVCHFVLRKYGTFISFVSGGIVYISVLDHTLSPSTPHGHHPGLSPPFASLFPIDSPLYSFPETLSYHASRILTALRPSTPRPGSYSHVPSPSGILPVALLCASSQRPSTSPHPRVRSTIQRRAVNSYHLNPAQTDLAYAVATWSVRPSTSASSLSTTGSAANTPGVDSYGSCVCDLDSE